MEAYEHFLISLALSIIAAPLIFHDAHIINLLLLVGYGTSAGVLIDLDHFLIATIRDRNFHELRKAISNPLIVVTDNNQALDNLIPNWSRYVSHLIILVSASSIAYYFSPEIGLFTFVILSTHIFSDIIRSIQNNGIMSVNLF